MQVEKLKEDYQKKIEEHNNNNNVHLRPINESKWAAYAYDATWVWRHDSLQRTDGRTLERCVTLSVSGHGKASMKVDQHCLIKEESC